MSYLRPDFSKNNNPESQYVSLLYKVEKDGKIADIIDGYWEFSKQNALPTLTKKKINEDKMVLATLKSGEVLYLDEKGAITKSFPEK